MYKEGEYFHPVFDEVRNYYGISIKDYFASQAMNSIINSDIYDDLTYRKIAEMSYDIADIMLAERKRRNEIECIS